METLAVPRRSTAPALAHTERVSFERTRRVAPRNSQGPAGRRYGRDPRAYGKSRGGRSWMLQLSESRLDGRQVLFSLLADIAA